jgi:hypothetical protein
MVATAPKSNGNALLTLLGRYRAVVARASRLAAWTTTFMTVEEIAGYLRVTQQTIRNSCFPPKPR